MKYTFNLDYKTMWESATDKALILQEENRVLKESSEHNDKVVDKVNWENMLLKKENQQLKECYCSRTDCSGRIKNSRNYDSLYQKYNKQLDNWNKLKEDLINDINDRNGTKIVEFEDGNRVSETISPIYTLMEDKSRTMKEVLDKMQELEQGSDSND